MSVMYHFVHDLYWLMLVHATTLLPSVQLTLITGLEMVLYVAWWRCSILVWFVTISAGYMTHYIAGSDVLHDVLHWVVAGYPCYCIVGSVFNWSLFCASQVIRLMGSIFILFVSERESRQVYWDCIVHAIIIHCGGIRRCRYNYKRTDSFWH